MMDQVPERECRKRIRSRALLSAGASLLTATVALAQPVATVIENAALRVQYISPGGYFLLVAKPSQRSFSSVVALSRGAGVAAGTNVTDKTFGTGQAIKVSYPDGSEDWIMVFPNLPFALFRSRIHNGGKETLVTQNVKALAARVDLGRSTARPRTFGTGGLLDADKNPGSYAWLGVVEPETRNGVVFGWLTHDRGSGVLFSKMDGEAVRVDAQIDYGRWRRAPGNTDELETLAVGYFDDARLGLEAWADAVAKVYKIHLPPQPAGYCTWYSQPHGGASDEKHLAEQAEFAAKHLRPFGFSVIQIDDKWQEGISTNGPKRNFTTHRPDGPYPGGMKAAAENVKSLGLVPGLWFMPFAGTYYDPLFQGHPDWFVKREDGRPYETAWGGACLDMTHPGAREHLRGVASRICRDWGYQYIKVDGLWTGTATKQQYVNSGYKDDGIGDAVFNDPDKTNIEAYRDGLRLLREAVGEKVFILGCNGPQNMRSYGGAFGLVDAMRIGPDNGADWGSLTRGTIFGSRHYFLHGRIWYNDPDPVYVRASMPLNHAQLICSWVTLTGQLNLSSEWFPDLPPERLDILKRTMPGHGRLPRPADIFENDPPRLWLLTDAPERGVHAASTSEKSATRSQMDLPGRSTLKRPEGRSPNTLVRREVIGVFNWESREQNFDYPLAKLGLDPNAEYVAFDYWANTLLPLMKGRLRITVPAESCRVIAVRPRARHPQLLSTSRHITQGIVDVLEEKWDARKKTLSGRSQVVAGDAYELRIVAEAGGKIFVANAFEVSPADASAGVKASLASDGKLVRATIEAPTSREVSWIVKFK
jgi:hypothetical protein